MSEYFVEKWDNKERVYIPAQQARTIWIEPAWRRILLPPLRATKRAVYRAIKRFPDTAASRGGEALRLVWRWDKFTLLDVGCSYGSFVKTARYHGIDAFGLDPNKELVSTIRDLGITFIHQGLFPERHGPRDRYDVITFISVVNNFPRITRSFFQECKRLLTPGGMLLICEIDPESSGTQSWGDRNSGVVYLYKPPVHGTRR